MIHLSPEVQHLIDIALAEDQAFGDVTTEALIPSHLEGVAVLRSEDEGILAGVDVALAVFGRVDPSLQTEALLKDQSELSVGSLIARITGKASGILRAERVALNFIQRMSGIATETSRYVKAVEGCVAKIVDTRKTVPGMRSLDKYAVRVGGGANHRMGLADGVLIKDNHIAALRSDGLSLKQAVGNALSHAPHTVKVEVEVTSLDELNEAFEAGAHVIMLDNMSLTDVQRAVEIVSGRAVLEASGGVTFETVIALAEIGVDLISVGSLTHSPRALDISLDLRF